MKTFIRKNGILLLTLLILLLNNFYYMYLSEKYKKLAEEAILEATKCHEMLRKELSK